ncbi:MAG: hypothetical protein ACTS5V_06945, partial [Giesbergeria sp.]
QCPWDLAHDKRGLGDEAVGGGNGAVFAFICRQSLPIFLWVGAMHAVLVWHYLLPYRLNLHFFSRQNGLNLARWC